VFFYLNTLSQSVAPIATTQKMGYVTNAFALSLVGAGSRVRSYFLGGGVRIMHENSPIPIPKAIPSFRIRGILWNYQYTEHWRQSQSNPRM